MNCISPEWRLGEHGEGEILIPGEGWVRDSQAARDRLAPDRDRDQQQAAEAADTATALRLLRHWNRWEIEAALATARAEEAARWQAKVEALADDLALHTVEPTDENERGFIRGLDHAARRVRAVLDAE